ncbi:hypothetical protein [Roseovarius indicus]|uniref:hypothetical protein n=1 Tax=Roseovarius indicus TaxID=540747 RepID=UPI0032ED9BA7
MCEVGPGIYKFTHRTFLEYFFARRLEEEAGGVRDLIEKQLVEKILNEEWNVVSHLALQIATFRSGPKSAQAVEALLSIECEELSKSGRDVGYLFFLARALEYLTLPEATIGKIVSHISQSIMVREKFEQDMADLLFELFTAGRNRAEYISKQLTADFLPILNDVNSSRRTALLRHCAARRFGIRASNQFSEDTKVVRNLRPLQDQLQRKQYQRAMEDVEEARTYCFVYSSELSKLYSVHGPRLLFGSIEDETPVNIDRLGVFVILTEIGRIDGNKSFRGGTHNPEENTQVLDALYKETCEAWMQKKFSEIIGKYLSYHDLSAVNAITFNASHFLRTRKRVTKQEREVIRNSVFIAKAIEQELLSRILSKFHETGEVKIDFDDGRFGINRDSVTERFKERHSWLNDDAFCQNLRQVEEDVSALVAELREVRTNLR